MANEYHAYYNAENVCGVLSETKAVSLHPVSIVRLIIRSQLGEKAGSTQLMFLSELRPHLIV